VGGEKKRGKERKEENEKGGVVERKEGDRFVLFFFLPASIYDNEREEKGKRRKRKRMLLLFSCSANARARAHTERSRKCETHIHILNG
jgi:hypothetical protein